MLGRTCVRAGGNSSSSSFRLQGIIKYRIVVESRSISRLQLVRCHCRFPIDTYIYYYTGIYHRSTPAQCPTIARGKISLDRKLLHKIPNGQSEHELGTGIQQGYIVHRVTSCSHSSSTSTGTSRSSLLLHPSLPPSNLCNNSQLLLTDEHGSVTGDRQGATASGLVQIHPARHLE